MMTDIQFSAWLLDPAALRVTLFEAGVNSGGVETVRYLATGGYVTQGSDAPPDTVYQAIVSGGLKVTETIALSAEASLSFGDIDIVNLSGERDGWLDDIWVNRPFKAWIGDARWPRADFRLIFNGVIADIGSKNRDRLNLRLRDKLQRLNTPVSDAKLGGATPNKDLLLPLAFGEVHNATPLLADPARLQYRVHGGALEAVFEVRDNGKPVPATVDAASGAFTLPAAPAGAVTASLQGDKAGGVYANTIAALVRRIVTAYGKASDRLADSDLDLANLAAFDAAHPQPVGLFLAERINVLLACQQLAASVGAQLSMSRTGLLRLLRIDLPPAGAALEIRATEQLDRSIAVSGRSDVASAVKLGYCRNWTVQQGLLTSIPPQHKDLFAQEWLSATASDSAVEAQYKLDAEPPQKDSCLLTRTDALAEAGRQLALYRQPRTAYRFEGTPGLLMLELGQSVRLFSNRFGLRAGKLGVVISLAPDWMNGHITVEVLI